MKSISFLLFASMMSLHLQAQIPAETIVANPRQIQLPYNRLIQSAGIQILFGNEALENHALDAALSPDKRILAVEERTSIVFISTSDNKIKFTLPLDNHPDLKGGMNTYSGITWHNGADGYEVYWSAIGVRSRSFVVSAKWNGQTAEFGRMFEYKTLPPARMALPNEIIIKQRSRQGIFVCSFKWK